MQPLDYDSIQVGDSLPALTLPPINRTTLALFAGASGDHNPIHIDMDYARKAGMPDVFAHGMLSMAYLGRFLTGWVDQRYLRHFSARFTGITQLGNELTCSGRVIEKSTDAGERRMRIEIMIANQDRETKVQGEAVIALPV